MESDFFLSQRPDKAYPNRSALIKFYALKKGVAWYAKKAA
jgi:hypothetical protein